MISKIIRIGLAAVIGVVVLFALLPAPTGYAGFINDEEPVGSTAPQNTGAGATVPIATMGTRPIPGSNGGTYLYPPIGDGYVLLTGFSSKFWIFAPKDACFRVPEDSDIPYKYANYKGEPCIP
jgi:hypothetical protein